MAEGQIKTLSYAVRGRAVARFFGALCVILAALLSVCVAASVLFGEFGFTVSFGASTLVSLCIGLILWRVEAPPEIRANEALVVAALIFLFAALLLALPMMTAGLSAADALFESVSAVTTTGLSTAGGVAGRPATFVFSRAWMQWFGGLGIVVLSAALMMQPGTATRRLIDMGEGRNIPEGTTFYARRVVKVYVALTAGAFALLIALGVDAFTALVHVLAGISTGGFSSYDDSLAGLGSDRARSAVMLISFLGAVSLPLYWRIVRRDWRRSWENAEWRGLLALCLLMSLILTAGMRRAVGMPWEEALVHGPLLALSAQTTTGFSTLRVADLDSASKLVLILSMAIGGSIGSTAGGIKVFRLLVLFKVVQYALARSAMPEHAVLTMRLSGQRLRLQDAGGALVVTLLFVAVILLSWIPFVALGYDPLDSLFEVVSAAGTVGLSTGICRPDLDLPLKAVLCGDMLLGRLEILAVVVLFYPGTWFGRRG